MRMSPIQIFCSYFHADEGYCNDLRKHLSVLERNGTIATWYDRRILAGEEWSGAIDANLRSSDIILLLISPDFVASDYCYNIELAYALSAHKRGLAVAIPIFVRPVDWSTAPFSMLQGLPRDGRPISDWKDPDEPFVLIVKELRRVIDALQSSPRKARMRVQRIMTPLLRATKEIGREYWITTNYSCAWLFRHPAYLKLGSHDSTMH
jgi:hypothetical protein